MFCWRLIGPCVCAVLSCANSSRASMVAVPRIEMPEVAKRPCHLRRLPPSPTTADLEVSFAMRGADLAACELARKLAVETFDAQSALVDGVGKPARRSWRNW